MKASPASPLGSKLLLFALNPAGIVWNAAPSISVLLSDAPLRSTHAAGADNIAAASTTLVKPFIPISAERTNLLAPERSALESFTEREHALARAPPERLSKNEGRCVRSITLRFILNVHARRASAFEWHAPRTLTQSALAARHP